MSTLRIAGLEAAVAGHQILFGIDLEAESGEVHAVMGPNGSGKSTLGHVLMGHPAYEVIAGSVTLDGVELLGLPTAERARAGLFLAPQDPIEVPGVALESALGEALAGLGRPDEAVTAVLAAKLAAEADAIGFDRGFLERPMNVDLSGGERKRNETVQLVVLRPRFAVLDEIDSGLDVDALRAVARRIELETAGRGAGGERLGVLAITHYTRLARELRTDVVHVMSGGRIVATGGPELADELERTGYDSYASV